MEFVETCQSKSIICDRGARLSGGQKQRIGIARHYNDPSIIIMDESTNS